MALRKTKTASGQYRVTFELPPAVNGEDISLCGEFNDWSPDSHRLKRRKDGRYSITMTLPGGRRYRYRYLINGEFWENDWHADEYVPNEYGGDDSVIDLDASSGGNGTAEAAAEAEQESPAAPGAAVADDEAALASAPEPNEPG